MSAPKDAAKPFGGLTLIGVDGVDGGGSAGLCADGFCELPAVAPVSDRQDQLDGADPIGTDTQPATETSATTAP